MFMKQNFMVVLCALVFTAISFTACQKEELISPNSKISYRAATWSHTGGVCVGDEHSDLTVTFCNGLGNSCGFIQIHQVIGDDTMQLVHTAPVAGCQSATVTGVESGTYHFIGRWQRTGKPSDCPGEQTGWIDYFVEVEPCGCDDSFTAACGGAEACADRDHSITFTYVAGDDGNVVIQGGLNANATDICTSSSEGTVIPWGNENNADVRRLVTDVEECDIVTVTISWNGPGNTGSWSAKLNGTAVGGDLDTGYLSAQNCTD